MEYTILTAAQSGEARLATWSEVGLHAGVWTLPAERMKSGREHRVPLSTRALELLIEAQKLSDGSGLLFPSPTGKALSSVTTRSLLIGSGIDATMHGFRTSFRSLVRGERRIKGVSRLCACACCRGCRRRLHALRPVRAAAETDAGVGGLPDAFGAGLTHSHMPVSQNHDCGMCSLRIVPIWHTRMAPARRVKGRICSIIRWAIVQNYI